MFEILLLFTIIILLVVIYISCKFYNNYINHIIIIQDLRKCNEQLKIDIIKYKQEYKNEVLSNSEHKYKIDIKDEPSPKINIEEWTSLA